MAHDAPPPHAADELVDLLDDAAPALETGASWRVLIVDDDEDVHRSTELALRGITIEGRRIEFCHAHSAAAARTMIERDHQLAAVLLDVVMETPDAGLQLVRQVREELQRQELRIILRTGQPGYAPELETIRHYDINDYRTKGELTQVRLFTSLTTAIRGYRQTLALIAARDELAVLAANLLEARAAQVADAAHRADAEQLEQRSQALRVQVDELESFNRMVAHDLRGPLHGLSSVATLIQQELDQGRAPQARHWLGLMATQTRRLSDLVDQLLGLARAGHGPLQRRPVTLDELARDALQTLALSWPAERLAAVTLAPLPPVQGDAALLRQVFVNLIGNALKFCRDAAQPHITVEARRRERDWVIEVCDNGIGFEAARAAALFTPFARLHGGRFEGAGLGLAVVRRIVERHGGSAWAESAPGAGARFCFSLPDQAAAEPCTTS